MHSILCTRLNSISDAVPEAAALASWAFSGPTRLAGSSVKFTVALGTLVTVAEILGYDGDLHYDCDLLFGLRRLPRWPILTDLRTQRSPRDYLMERMRGDSNLEGMN